MIMVHSDDMGLVLPPKVAHTQVVIIAIEKVGEEESNKAIKDQCNQIHDALKKVGIRVTFDDRDIYKSGWKFNYWEQRGVPIRIEIGKKDFDNGEVRCCKRHDGVKMQLKNNELAS